ncbi:MAG: LacI family transcriptional regulator [Ruminococcaceae bacterium]|nr:LacI family transcriptional regulator [Oscillospiraceae bacterium]
MSEKVTIYTLAEELGMTPSMISRALNPNASVSEKKRKLVLEAAEKHGFMPNKFASRLSMDTIRIGILYRYKFMPVTDRILAGIKKSYEELADYKISYDITLISAAEKKAEDCEAELFRYVDYDGVIISGFSSEQCTPMLERFLKKNKNLVQVQNANEQVPYLFASMHNTKNAARLSAEFLYHCTKNAPRQNILLFTGDLSSTLHREAKEAFSEACTSLGLHLLETVDMQDQEKVLKKLTPEVLEKYKNEVDGIYITCGNSIPLCQYLYEQKLPVSLVTFDTFDELNRYIENGTISATIYQNLEKQGKNAFEKLVFSIIRGEKPPKKVYTNIELVLKSNLAQYL